MATPSQIFQSPTAGDSRLFYQQNGQFQQIASPTQLQELAKQGVVQVGGARGTLPSDVLASFSKTDIQPVTVTSGTDTANNLSTQNVGANQTTPNLEVRPGVYNSSGLVDFYQNQISRMRPQSEQAQTQLADINKQISALAQGPSLSEQFKQESQMATSGLDATLAQRSNELNALTQSLANIEGDVRARVGGQAPESYIQALISKEAAPLVNRAQALQQNIGLLQEQRQAALQTAQQSIQLSQADRQRQLDLLGVQQNLAQQTMESFNTLVEKGAQASQQEQERAQALFSNFLEQSPGFLSKLSQDEIAQLQRGVLPFSAIQKLGDEIASQPKQTKGEIIGSAEMGYFRVDPFTGETTPLIAPRPAGSSTSEADIRQLADSLFANDTSIATYQDAYMQAQSLLRGETPQSQQAQILPIEQWAMKQNPALGTAIKLGLPISDTVRNEYDAYVALSTPQRSTRASTKAPTADQMKAATFADRTRESHAILNDVESQFISSDPRNLLGGLAPNVFKSEDRQKFEQAKRNFINAVLRRESGAAIAPSEFESADLQYFAQPGDTPSVLEQKRRNRETAINGLLREAGPALLQQGFNSVPSMTLNGSLGSLSARFESKGNPGVIGYDSTGGLSYGAYQLAHNNAKTFIEQSPYASEFRGLPFNSQQFQNKWKQIAQRDPQGFLNAQHQFIQKTHFEPQVKKLKDAGINIASFPQIVKDVIWSTAVQHGPNNDIIKQAVAKTKSGNPEELIRNIYALRWAGGRNFARSTPEVKQSVYNRFFGPQGEMQLALSSIRQSNLA